MTGAHSAGSRESRPCQRASQIVIRISVVARKTWASQAEDSLHLSRRDVHGEQLSSKPQIDHAPVNRRKAFLNVPTLHPASINAYRCWRGDRALRADVQAGSGAVRQRSWGGLFHGLHGRTQQILGGAGQNRARFEDFDPRSRTGGHTTFELLIGEPRQSSQVTPAGAAPIAVVGARQLFTNQRGHLRFQGGKADANPSLEMARAGLQHHTRLMAMVSHARQYLGRSMVQVEENVAGVAIVGVRKQINIKAMQIACAQKVQHRCPHQLTHIPHSFTWAGPACGAMDQANEIEIIRHSHQLAPDRMRGQEESAIEHGTENAAEVPRAYNGFSANGNNPLKAVSHSRGASHNCRPFPPRPLSWL